MIEDIPWRTGKSILRRYQDKYEIILKQMKGDLARKG